MTRPYLTNIIYDRLFDEEWSVYDYKNASAVYGMITVSLYTGAFVGGIITYKIIRKRFT